MGRAAIRIALLLSLAGLAAASLVYGVSKARTDSADLERRAEEVQRFLRRQDPYQDDQRDNTYPPSALPVFAALVPVGSPSLRREIWIMFNVAAALAIGAIVATTWGRSWPPWLRAAFGLVVAASKPARAGIALGQFHLIPTALVLGAEATLCAGRPVASGVLVGIALIKPTMAAPYVCLLAVRRQWKTIGVALGLQAILSALASAWLGIGPITLVQEWLGNAKSQLVMGTIDLPGLLSFFLEEKAPSATASSLVTLVVAAFLLWRYRTRSSLGLVSLALFFAAVMTYHRHYDMVLLLPALAYFMDAAVTGRRGAAPLAGAFTVILIAPSHPSIAFLSEQAHTILFVVGAYLALGALLGMIATEACGETSAASPSPWGDGRGH